MTVGLELMFLLSGCEARRAARRERVRAALVRTDFDAFARELAARRLLPLIGTRVLQAGPDLTPPTFARIVEQSVLTARAVGLAVEAATDSVVADLATEGIPALPLKGPSLAVEAHGDFGLRETADVDILVHRNHLEPAVATLRRAGYLRRSESTPAGRLPDLHVALRHPDTPPVDVHWRVYWSGTDFSDSLLENATPRSDGVLQPRPYDMAASLLLFYARDGFHGLRLASDVAGWWDRRPERPPEGFLEGHLRSFPDLSSALTAAATVVERVTGTPTRSWLGSAGARGRRVSVAVRLANWPQLGDQDQLAANVSLVGGLLGPRGSLLDFARRELCSQHSGLRATAAHASKMWVRYAAALWSVRGGRQSVTVPLA